MGWSFHHDPEVTMTGTKNKNHTMDMTEGPLLSKILLFTIPLMFSSILQILFNAADIVVVGKFVGDTALAAVGSNSALVNLVTNLFIGLSIGANVVVARYFGAKKEKEKSPQLENYTVAYSLFNNADCRSSRCRSCATIPSGDSTLITGPKDRMRIKSSVSSSRL